MRNRNWSQYNAKLVERGSITFVIEEKTFNKIKNFRPRSTGGRPREYPLALIELLLLIKVRYGLAYRELEGFARSIFKDIEIPSYTIVCRRAKEVTLPKLSRKRPSVVLLDGSGIKVFGEGEWKRKIHGVGKPRKWLKLHIAVDEHSQQIVGEFLTDSRVADCTMVEDLLEASGSSVKIVKADGAYNGASSWKSAERRGISLVSPPPKNARVRGKNKGRDDDVLIIQGLGGGSKGRRLWSKLKGYNYRALVETAFSRYKRIFEAQLSSRTFERQVLENRLRWVILNKMAA